MLPRKAPGAGLWRWTLLYVTALILARADVDGENPSLNIVASEVNLHGRTRVSGASLIKGIGHGVFQVRDKEAKNTLLVGTSKAKGAGPGVRIIPVEGSGVGLTSSSDRGGLFVSMGS